MIRTSSRQKQHTESSRGTLWDIAEKVKEAGIKKTALTVVGDFLGDEYELSRLYDKTFTHEFRKGVNP